MLRTLQRALAVAAVAALAASAVHPSAAADPETAAPPSSPPTASSTVTLLTGDVVHVTSTSDGRPAVTVEPPPTATGGVHTYTVGDELYVVPDAARRFIAAGTVDDQLFNVTKLLEFGYDDVSTDTIPLIATYRPAARRARGLTGTETVRALPSIGGAALAADKDDAADTWSALTGAGATARSATASGGGLGSGLEKVWLDGRVEATLDVSVPQVHAPEAWAAGHDGTGVTVAVLDTGIDPEHPDIASALTGAVSFVPGVEVTDSNGHGTHVASTVLGSGAASEGGYQGVAPGAELKVGKVLDDDGFGQDSWLIAGMEWAAGNADVVNMSLGDPDYTDGKDPMSRALNTLTEQTGTLFVVAAGNRGAEGTIGSPGAADRALTVGAVDDNDIRTWFSSMGPRTGDGGMKPDLSAPGQGIVAARSQFAPGDGPYQSMDGTSMATPHVAGAAAIVRAANPDWSPEDAKNALMSNSDPLPGTTPYELGAGRLNVASTLGDVRATGSAFFGYLAYPHDDAGPAERTVTYTNDGDTDVTLTLDADLDLVTLSTDEVMVPAGGSVDVVATVDPQDADGTGRFTGFIVASDASGAVVARTAAALVKEDERYDVDITVLGRDGEPTSGVVHFYRYGEQFVSALPIDPSTGATPTQRIAPGVVNATVFLDVEGESGPGSAGVALLGQPHVTVDSNVELVFDARDAVEVTVQTPKASEDSSKRIQYFHDSGIGGPFATFSAGYQADPDIAHLYAAPTGPVAGGVYDFAVTWRRTAPLLDLAAFTPGRTAIDPLYQNGSTRLDGRVDLAGVYAGHGTPADYGGIDADGKAVIVTWSDMVNPFDRAAAADAAGAALLVVVNDGPSARYEFAGGTDVPVVSVPAGQGAALVQAAEQGRLRFRGKGTEFSPYTYTISKSWPGEIPAAGLAVAPQESELARIDTRFIDSEQRLAFGTTYDCREYQWPPCLGVSEPQGTQSERVDYVSTYDGNTWYQQVAHVDGWEQRGRNRTYEPGEVVELDWFSPVVRPRLGEGYWGSRHDGDWFALNVPPSSGPGGITGSRGQGYDDRIESRLYQDGELVRTSPSQAIQRAVPVVEGPATYRFEYDTVALDGDPWVNSTRTSSAWTFVADQASPPASDGWTYLPLLQLDYDIDVAVDGTARSIRRDTIGVSAGHEPGVAGAGEVERVTLEISYDDGATWREVALRPDGAGWSGPVMYPREATFVSLRASAADDAGNQVQQEIIRAYGLRWYGGPG